MLKKLVLVSAITSCIFSLNANAACGTASFIPKLVIHADRVQDLFGNHWYQIQNDTPYSQTYDVCFITKFGNQPATKKYETNECKRIVLQTGENSGRVQYDQWVRDTYWPKEYAGAGIRAEAYTSIKGECTADSHHESAIKVKG